MAIIVSAISNLLFKDLVEMQVSCTYQDIDMQSVNCTHWIVAECRYILIDISVCFLRSTYSFIAQSAEVKNERSILCIGYALKSATVYLMRWQTNLLKMIIKYFLF